MRNTIFPVYVVIDFSESMLCPIDSSDSRKRIDVAKDIIPTLLNSMEADASVAESLRVRVIGFNQGVIFSTKLYEYYELEQWYSNEKNNFELKCNWQTWYGAAFEKLNTCINEDINNLIQNGYGYYRPLVYFLTDGIPQGEDSIEREKKYHNLVNNVDPHRNPVIFCVGIGSADMKILKKYGASRLGSKNGDYITNNSRMTFIIRKGVKTGEGLEILNDNVVETIKYSLQQRSSSISSNNINDIDTSVFDDEDVNKKIQDYFGRDPDRNL